ncbi:MAG: hypothetical protein A2Y17_02885 [Clostridiales bacterium GWF2_38_85]|nr:MAG: hypothetical protein A2Y17_02885 [Clostridiales bacterium GWF2_38_85]
MKKSIKYISLFLAYIIMTVTFLNACEFNKDESKPEDSNSTISNNESITSNTISTMESNTSIDNSQDTSSETTSEEESTVSEVSEPSEPPIVQDTDLHGLTIQECNEYFNNSAFIGDSIAVGLKARVQAKLLSDSNYFANPLFLCSESYGFYNALKENSSLHPTYNGEQMPVWDAIAEAKVSKVFIMLGLNDFAGSYATTGISNAEKLINKILEKSPDVEIIITSTSYYVREGEKPDLGRTNEVTRECNELMLQFCNDNGYDYIDISTCLTDDEGYLISEYSPDHYVHLYYQYYDRWIEIFRGYAADKILGQYQNIKTMLLGSDK